MESRKRLCQFHNFTDPGAVWQRPAHIPEALRGAIGIVQPAAVGPAGMGDVPAYCVS